MLDFWPASCLCVFKSIWKLAMNCRGFRAFIENMKLVNHLLVSLLIKRTNTEFGKEVSQLAVGGTYISSKKEDAQTL